MDPIRFGKFWLLEKIATGGMAEIFKAAAATPQGGRQIVAIKRILPDLSSDEEFISMLVDEAKVMVRLNHPNIVPMMEFGKVEDSYYIAMEYVAGVTLKALFRAIRESGAQVPLDVAIHLVREIGAGLAYAHRRSDEEGRSLEIVHRDVSPANILISFQGEVKIADFGIAKAVTQSHRTQHGVIRGKTGYMSPEQTRSGTVIDHRSDLYALGIILFELVTGERLYKADSVLEALRMIRQGEIPPIAPLRPGIPEELEAIIRKALAPDPTQRYLRAEDFVDALSEFLVRSNLYKGSSLVTHGHLADLVRKHFRRQADDFTEIGTSPSAPPIADAVTVKDTAIHAGTRGALSRPEVIALNPKYELSEAETVAPVRRDEPSQAATATQTASPSQPLNEAISASIRIAMAWSPMVVASMAAGALVVGLLVLFLRWGGKPTPGPPTAASPTPTVEAATTATPRAKVPPTPRFASARLETVPSDARVFVDGEEAPERTLLRIEKLIIGKSYKLRFEKAGYDPLETELKVTQPGELRKRYLLARKGGVEKKPTPSVGTPRPLGDRKPKLPKGRLVVLANPWAIIYVDGTSVATTPTDPILLEPGKHHLRLYCPPLNREFANQIRITSGRDLKCTADFQNRNVKPVCKP